MNFTPVPDTGTTYSISGTVSGAVAAGVAITLNGANSASATTDLGGNYSFTGLVRGTYSVGAALAHFTKRPWLWSATRQLLISVVAASVTFAIGHVIGASG